MPGTWKALSFCLYTEIFICTTSQKGIVLPVPSRERGGYCQYQSFFLFPVNGKPRAGLITILRWLPSVNLLPSLKKPQWCELEQKPLHQQGKTSYSKSAPQSSDTEWKGHELPLPTPSRTILATFHFLKSLQKTHTIIHFNWHLQALVIDHLEKRHKTLDACVGRMKVGYSPLTAAVCPYYWALSHKLLCILYSVLISDTES